MKEVFNKQENQTEIVVPKGVRYISLWEDFEIPQLPHIMDKQIPGCGFTEFCIRNKINTILASPRKVLLENKYDQHKDDVYLVVNEFDPDNNMDKDLMSKRPDNGGNIPVIIPTEEELKGVFDRVRTEIIKYLEKMKSLGKPYKILVTYDSFRIVKEIFNNFGMLDDFQIVVDEFQSIFTDSRFKSSTELGFVSELQGLNSVCYLSATPMMKKYLGMLDEFKDLPYYVLDWSSEEPMRIIRPNLKVRVTQSITSTARQIIDTYRTGNFAESIRGIGNIEYSKEAVFYVNSVNNITLIIKKCGLKPEECNILVSKTIKNEKKIRRKLGKKYQIGRVPLKGEPRKMFTFCTRTVYLGADFYSDNARTFVLSDANIQTLAVDISLDLPQILGRQRLDDNPWKNEAEFYYRPLTDKNSRRLVHDDFIKEIAKKTSDTNLLINVCCDQSEIDFDTKEVLLDKYGRDIVNSNYKFDYLAINTNKKDKQRVAVFNTLVSIAELRAYEIQDIDYRNRFTVFSSISGKFGMSALGNTTLDKFYEEYFKLGDDMHDKLKYICELELTDEEFENVKKVVDERVRSFLSLGKKLLKSNSYQISKIMRAVRKRSGADQDPKELACLETEIYSEFSEGDELTSMSIKETLKRIYDKLGYEKKKAVASSLKKFFEMKPGKFKNSDNKWENGFKLIKKLK